MTDKQYAIRKWGLCNFRTIYERDFSAVWFAESEQFGPVVLKWNSGGQLDSEYRMLSRLQGQGTCKVYGYDKDRGLLLEERILPGVVLRKEPSLKKRIEVLSGVLQKIHRPQTEGESYLDWLDRVCDFSESHEMPENLSQKAGRARDICAYLFEKYPERFLLHGDLHHDNLLCRADGRYAVIDPKGVVGPAILDLPRFLLNEGDMSNDPSHMERAIQLVGQHLGYPQEDLRMALYMEAVLANVWCVEDCVPIPERWITFAHTTVQM